MKLSIAMIVKNEENNLERCLKSVQSIADEIIIVDTGSTDKTIEIAKKFTNKIYEQPWEGNFSKHRNYSLSLCQSEWIFQIDADEEFFLDGITAEQFKNGLNKVPTNINVVAMVLRDWNDAAQTYAGEADLIRLFRNGKVTFKRKIHNEPVFEGIAGFVSACWLKHYGYNMTPEKRLEKAQRTITLLKEEAAENPEDPQVYFYLAHALLKFEKNTEEALENAIKYHSMREKAGISYNSSIVHTIASLLINKKDYEKAMQYIDAQLRKDQHDVDITWDLMTVGIQTQRNDITLAGASLYVKAIERFMANRKQRSGILGNKFYFHVDPHSQATAFYLFSMLSIDSGITTLRNTLSYAKKNCHPQIFKNMSQQAKHDLKKLQLKDKTMQQNLIQIAGSGINYGHRHNRAMGNRR